MPFNTRSDSKYNFKELPQAKGSQKMNKFMAFAMMMTAACRPAPTRVVFLCEHGSAKSVIASLYFNKMAKEKGLDWTGIPRGLKADPHLQPATLHGLRADGFDVASLRPQDIDEKDLRSADVVVTIGCALPDRWTSPVRHVAWNDVPPVSEDYIAARDAIVGHLHDLLP
jgi:hypothetical protein